MWISCREWTVGFDELRQHVQAYLPEVAAASPGSRPSRSSRPRGLRHRRSGRDLQRQRPGQQTSTTISSTGPPLFYEPVTGQPGPSRAVRSTGCSPQSNRGAPPSFIYATWCPGESVASESAPKRTCCPTTSPRCPRSWSRPCSPLSPTLSGPPSSRAGAPAHVQQRPGSEKGFGKLGFLTVSDYFMTPTAELADIVLPVSMFSRSTVSRAQRACLSPASFRRWPRW